MKRYQRPKVKELDTKWRISAHANCRGYGVRCCLRRRAGVSDRVSGIEVSIRALRYRGLSADTGAKP